MESGIDSDSSGGDPINPKSTAVLSEIEENAHESSFSQTIKIENDLDDDDEDENYIREETYRGMF